ncbi:MAG: hypothetical protein K2G13_03620 [Muribaculaceae bacterium]|nr:hypothetical protein [Muribaculaceae bacterium]
MKKSMRVIIPFIIMFCLLIGCSNESDLFLENNATFQIYNLPYNLSLDVADETLVVIETQKEFKALFGKNTSGLEKINFKKYNLIYIQGKSTNHIKDIQTNWYSDDRVPKLEIVIDNNNFANEYREWCVGFLIPKDKEPIVQVEISYTRDSAKI